MRHPDGPRDKHIDKFVQSHDVMPTILDLLDVPFETDGTSVWPLVTGEAESIRDRIIIGWASWADGNAVGRASVRDDRWNFVISVGSEDPNPELYDLQADPEELNNVISDYPKVVTERKRQIEALVGQPLPGQMNEVCDPAPAPFGVYASKRFPRENS